MSKDILFYTIAACVALITIFSCWGLFYIIGFIRNTFKVSKDIKRIIEKIENLIDGLKEKIHSSTSHLLIIGEAVKKILEIANDIRESKKRKKKSDEK